MELPNFMDLFHISVIMDDIMTAFDYNKLILRKIEYLLNLRPKQSAMGI